MTPFTVLDFETYYDDSYTLKKLTTEEYTRDPRFKIHCVSIVSSDGTRIVINNDYNDLWEQLRGYMKGFVICHHAQFDGLILSHRLGLYPKYWGCTLSMARAQLQYLKSHSLESLAKHYGLPTKTIDYNAFIGKRDLDLKTKDMLERGCLHDAELTYTVAENLLKNFPPQELQIIDSTIRMFTEPCLELDSTRMEKELAKIKESKAHALESLGVTREDLQSSQKFGVLLQAQGIDIPMKYSEKQKKDIPALAKTDEGMKVLLEHEDSTVAALAAARLGEKSTILETRCERLLGMYSRGPLAVYLKYHGAHTGRWSGGDKVNFQNMTRGSELRKSIIAPPGYKLVGVDSAQIECRLLNWFSGQLDIVDAFRTGRDIYCENATKFFGTPITKKENEERQFGKVIELASGYGCGAVKFKTIALQQAKRKLTDEESRKAIDIYRSGHPHVCALWKRFQLVIENMGKGLLPYNIGCVTIDGYRIIMPGGTFLDYTGMYFDGEDYRYGKGKLYGGLVVENIIQKLGLLIISNAIINIAEKYDYKLALTTHDDLLYVVPKEDNQALGNVLKEMKDPPDWCKDIPLGAEGFESERYDK